jgi:hypothetical protein
MSSAISIDVKTEWGIRKTPDALLKDEHQALGSDPPITKSHTMARVEYCFHFQLDMYIDRAALGLFARIV